MQLEEAEEDELASKIDD